jgi:hypothetical protein
MVKMNRFVIGGAMAQPQDTEDTDLALAENTCTTCIAEKEKKNTNR